MIYLLRHGQTEGNRDRLYQGGCDSPLTELGENQARRVGRALAKMLEEPQDWRIVASPLGRTRRTAELVAAELPAPPPISFDPRLAEVTFGEWDGRGVAEIQALWPADLDHLERPFNTPGGESYADVSRRLSSWLGDLEDDHRWIVVSHGLSGRILRGLYAGLERQAMLMQDIPQDAFFRLHGGTVERIECTD
jgi:probable phosphoglycerate mutase